ncbi:hypothetical protein N0V90_005376 [Kalmusia sp. IMI 367209]|nr:hypothetical protein N0V90_005376 [Kalmusia sp. IMI 367209]
MLQSARVSQVNLTRSERLTLARDFLQTSLDAQKKLQEMLVELVDDLETTKTRLEDKTHECEALKLKVRSIRLMYKTETTNFRDTLDAQHTELVQMGVEKADLDDEKVALEAQNQALHAELERLKRREKGDCSGGKNVQRTMETIKKKVEEMSKDMEERSESMLQRDQRQLLLLDKDSKARSVLGE